MRNLIILPSAEADLQEIGDYIAEKNLDAAISFFCNTALILDYRG